MDKASVLTITAGGTVPELRRIAPELSPRSPSGALIIIQFAYRVSRKHEKSQLHNNYTDSSGLTG